MHQRVEELIRLHGLAPHPEGGFFRETFRSRQCVLADDRRGRRSALTTIFFLLASGQCSRWHRVASDEVWHYCEGAPLEHLVIDPSLENCRRAFLGPAGPEVSPVIVIPAGWWQAAASTADYTLSSCTVGPAFDFADFVLLADRPGEADQAHRLIPDFARFL